MKIKEICEKTGLTDRTVRYYIEEGLISPFYTENYLGRKAFDFSEQDLDRLKSVATLRSFGFTVEEIKALSLGDADSRQIVDAVKQRASENLDESQRRIDVLSEVDLSGEDLIELSKKLYDRDMAIRNENVTVDPKKKLISFLKSFAVFLAVWLPIFLAVFVLVVKIAVLDMPIVRPVFLFCTVLCFLPSLFIVLILKKTNETKIAHRTLTIFCLVCLPLSIFFSYKSITVCNHSYDTYRTIVAATCSREGEAVLTCKECGGFTVKKLQKLPHQTVVTKGYAPTCSRAGLSDGSYCSVCNKVFIAQIVLPATQNHTIVIDKAVDATCAVAGLSEGSHCSFCKKTIVRQKILERLPHEYENGLCKNCGGFIESQGLEFSKIHGGYELLGIGTCRDEIIYIPSSYNGLPVIEIAHNSLCFVGEDYSPREIVIPDSVQNVCCGAMSFSKFVKVRVGKNAVFKSNSISHSGGIEIVHSATSVIPSNAYNWGDDTTPCVVHQANESSCITTEDGFVFIESGSTYFLCDYIGTAEDITLPEHCNGKPYVIAENCFYKNKVISNVKIGNGVTKISYDAFYESSVKHVDLSGQFTVLPARCFMKCTQLESVVIPDNIELIEMQCFDMSGLRTVTIGKNVKKIEYSVFQGCPNLDTLYYNAVNCTLASSSCFRGFIKVVIGASVPAIPKNFMYQNGTLKFIVFEENSSCTSIDADAFSKCAIVEVILPDTLTTIGENAFSYCSNLKSIHLPDSLIKISDSAFQRCAKLATISGGDSNFIIEQYAFYECSSLIRIDFPNVKQYGNYAFGGCSLLESVTLSEDVTVLPQSIFANCTSLTSITLPAALTTIGNAAFQRTAITEIVLPDSVETVEMYAFSCCYDLQTISLSANLKSIGTMVFEQCDALQKVEIPNKVTSIPRLLFFSCSSLTEVVLPDSVISMGDAVFHNCHALRSVILPKDLTYVPASTFAGCEQLESVQLPPNLEKIDNYAFSYCTSLKEIVIPNSCVSIGTGAFNSCVSLEKVEFGNSITTIGSNAFSNCAIVEAILPDTLNSIGSFAFSYCTKLTTVYLGNSITNIEYQAFYTCTALRTVFLPKSLRSILPANYDISPFYNCSADLRLYSDMETGSAVWQSYFGLVNYGYSYQAYLEESGAKA